MMMNRKNASKMQKTFLIVLVVMLSIGLILPSVAQIVFALMNI